MKKHSLLLTIVLLVALLATVTPVAADAREPVGSRINLFFGASQEFPAGEPFYIQHGWLQPPTDGAIGVFDFELEVDGVLLQEDFKKFSAEPDDPNMMWRLWLYNFPEGMTGVHTFTGHWFAPCQYAVDQSAYPGPCATPNAKVQISARTVTVTFVP